jgi:hypothetical protein
MNKEFVPYEELLVLKELGFDEPCYGYYGSHQVYFWTVKTPGHYDNDNNALPAPLYQQAFRWFREKYNLEYQIMKSGNGNYYVTIHKNTQEYLDSIVGLTHACLDEVVDCYSYEEAELECLRKLIEITKK